MSEYIKGTNLEQVFGKLDQGLKRKIIRRLNYHEDLAYEITDGGLTFFDLLNLASERISMSTIARQVGISRPTLTKLYKAAGIPVLSNAESIKVAMEEKWKDPKFRKRNAEGIKANWQNPDFRRKHAEAVRAMLEERWKDPNFRQRISAADKAIWQDPEFSEFRKRNANATRAMLEKRWKDPEYRQRQNDAMEAMRAVLKERRQDPKFRQRASETTQAKWQDPEYRQRTTESLRAMLEERWKDPEFRERHAEANRVMLEERWKDLDFRQRNAEGVRANWQDPDFRKRNAEGTRAARARAENQGRYYLPTLKGERRDIGYANSAWEANIARVLSLVGREVITHQPLTLSNGTQLVLDFITAKPLDSSSMIRVYEIMAHPLESPEGWNKLLQAQEEYPHLNIRPITASFYYRLAKIFANRINGNQDFCGWETADNNLRTNPAQFIP